MSIIARRSNLINVANFLELIHKKEFIDGLNIDVTITKDKQLIIFVPTIMGGTLSIETIQSSNYCDLGDSGIYSLEVFFTNFIGWKKKILLNIIPLINPPLSEETASYISKRNSEYIDLLTKIISNYPSLKIYLSSVNYRLVDLMEKSLSHFKIGLAVSPENQTYLDVDYYILPPSMLDGKIMKQQIDLGKEMMILVMDGNQMSIVFQYFITDKTEEIFKQLIFICSYPEMFNSAFIPLSAKEDQEK